MNHYSENLTIRVDQQKKYSLSNVEPGNLILTDR